MNNMELLAWLVVGGVAGWIASIIMKNDSSQGTIMDIVLGVIGAVVGGFLMNLVGLPGANGINLYSLAVAIMGAAALIWVGRLASHSHV